MHRSNRWIACYEYASVIDGPPVTGIPGISRTVLPSGLDHDNIFSYSFPLDTISTLRIIKLLKLKMSSPSKKENNLQNNLFGNKLF